MKGKIRTPTRSDVEKSDRWLEEARHWLANNEFHRVKRMCRQVINALRRKDSEAICKLPPFN